MSAEPSGRAELLRLFGAYTSGTITPQEHASLETRLAADGAARRLWFLHCDLEAGLHRLAAATIHRENIFPASADRRGWWERTFPKRRWTLALAAGFFALAVAGGLLVLRPGRASAADLVRQSLAAQQDHADRCYRVSFHPANGAGPAPDNRETLLWTRGDRFCVEARVGDGPVLAWGRDERGGVWFAVSPEKGGFFASDEVPARLAQLCDLRNLQTDGLLRALLADFDLRRETAADGGQTVFATLKPGHQDGRYRSARLELDGDSGALRRVEVERRLPGRGPVMVTFTLVQTGLCEDASYTLAGHLRPGAAVADAGSVPGMRGHLLEDFIVRLRERP